MLILAVAALPQIVTECCERNHVSLDELDEYDDQELIEIGITATGIRKSLLLAYQRTLVRSGKSALQMLLFLLLERASALLR